LISHVYHFFKLEIDVEQKFIRPKSIEISFRENSDVLH